MRRRRRSPTTTAAAHDCTIETLLPLQRRAERCQPIIEFVAIRRFNISQVSPAGLNYDPDRRAFAGHKSQDSQEPIELCLDGTLIDPTTAPTRRHDLRAGRHQKPLPMSCAVNPAADPCYVLPPRPVTAGTLVGSTYDPFTDHYLFLTTRARTPC